MGFLAFFAVGRYVFTYSVPKSAKKGIFERKKRGLEGSSQGEAKASFR